MAIQRCFVFIAALLITAYQSIRTFLDWFRCCDGLRFGLVIDGSTMTLRTYTYDNVIIRNGGKLEVTKYNGYGQQAANTKCK